MYPQDATTEVWHKYEVTVGHPGRQETHFWSTTKTDLAQIGLDVLYWFSYRAGLPVSVKELGR